MTDKSQFVFFAEKIAQGAGTALIFTIACSIVVIWALTGPLFDFSDTWQLVINTGTTVVTFLMVFLIQNTQDRYARSVQLKLDELLRATRGAHIRLIDLEKLKEEELKEIQDRYLSLAQDAHARLKRGEDDSNTPEIALP